MSVQTPSIGGCAIRRFQTPNRAELVAGDLSRGTRAGPRSDYLAASATHEETVVVPVNGVIGT